MKRQHQSGITEISLLLISTSLLAFGFLLSRTELLSMKREKLIQSQLKLENNLRRKMVIELKESENELSISSSKSSTLDYLEISNSMFALKTMAHSNSPLGGLPNWTVLTEQHPQQKCLPSCSIENTFFQQSTHFTGPAHVANMSLEQTKKNADPLIVSVWGSLQINRLYLNSNVDSAAIEIIAKDQIYIGEVIFSHSGALNLKIHSSLGDVEVNQSNILGCPIVFTNERRFSSDLSDCKLAKDKYIWPELRILGESLEKFYYGQNH